MTKRSTAYDLLSATLVLGLLGFGVYKGTGEIRERLRNREIGKALDRGDFSYAVQRYDDYARQELLDADDLAKFQPQIKMAREQLGSAEKRGILETLNKAIDELRPRGAAEIVQEAARTGFFDTGELDRMRAKLEPLRQETFWYTRIANAPATIIPEATRNYLQAFPDGEHRDAIVTQHLSLAYRNAQQRIMDRDVTGSLAAITTLTKEFETPWATRPRWAELLDARKGFHDQARELINMAPSPSEKYLPGVPVQVIASGANWKEEYRQERDQQIGIGSIGVVDTMAPHKGTGNSEICVRFPDIQIAWKTDWNGPCTQDRAPHRAEYDVSELRRVGLTVAERSRIRVLLDNLERTERQYFEK